MLRILMLCLLASPAWLNAAEAPVEVEGAMTISVYQAKQLHELGAVFVDVRPRREWAWGHVEGAVNLDLAHEFFGLSRSDWPRTVPIALKLHLQRDDIALVTHRHLYLPGRHLRTVRIGLGLGEAR